MKKYLLLLLLAGIALSAQAQRLITGTVTEEHTGLPLPGAHVVFENENIGTVTNLQGHYEINWQESNGSLRFSFPGCATMVLIPGKSDTLDVLLSFERDLYALDTVITFDPETYEEPVQIVRNDINLEEIMGGLYQSPQDEAAAEPNTEDYSPITENADKSPLNDPLSTFSIDVDKAAYSNVRRFIYEGELPPVDAVRIEEMVNYFDYDYPQPKGEVPFSVQTELSDCPWNEGRKLLLIGLQGKDIDYEQLPPSHLTFLLDVSGSMNESNKLPLLQSAMRLLVEQLRPQDRVSIVVYAGAAGLVLPPTAGSEKALILSAIDSLWAGGSTAGGEGIELAYKIATENFLKDGNNRVILATDGDFNVGISSDGELLRLIEKKRQSGVFLTVLGFGMGNYKDNKLELLADKGNGNYAYIDNLMEAQKLFVHDLRGTLFTIAKDVKIQVEFNPQLVASYRLVGYENRLLNKEDFNDDSKDAGELGAGHQVTALYELVLQNSPTANPTAASVDALRYQQYGLTSKARSSGELATLKLRYQPPTGGKSKLIEQHISQRSMRLERTSDNFRFATAVAGFGMLLRSSDSNKNLKMEAVKSMAQGSMSKDLHGYRKEFLELVKLADLMRK